MSNQKDYFIKDSGISAYTINAFVEAIVEATKDGYEINYDSARRISTSFCVNFYAIPEKEDEAQEEPAVEAQAPAQEEAPESPAQPEESAEESSEQSEEESDESSEPVKDIAYQGQPFTLEDVEAAKNSMVKLNELAEPVGISGRSKKDVAQQLREYIGA